MKVVLAGAYGNLGADVFRSLIGDGHEVVALDMMERDIGITTGFTFIKVDVTDSKTLNGVCDGADASREISVRAGSQKEWPHLCDPPSDRVFMEQVIMPI